MLRTARPIATFALVLTAGAAFAQDSGVYGPAVTTSGARAVLSPTAQPAPGVAKGQGVQQFNAGGSYSPSFMPLLQREGGNDATATTNVSRVTFAQEGADFDPCVSPDGSFLVFASTQHRSTPDIYFSRVGSRTVTQLTSDPAQDVMPRISPDGRMIAFASDRSGNWDIYVMPVTGGKPIQVTTDPSAELAPSWSPDGSQLAFTRLGEATQRWEMWTASVAKPDVARFIGFGLFPQWAPVSGTGANGADRLLFQLARDRGSRTFSLWTMDLTSDGASNPTEVASSVDSAFINPTWSPDGRWIAFAEVNLNDLNNTAPTNASNTRFTPFRTAKLWMISSEGERAVALTSGDSLALSPAWAKDDRLFFVSDRAGAENIWSLDISSPVATARAMLGQNQNSTHANHVSPADHGAHGEELQSDVASVPAGDEH